MNGNQFNITYRIFKRERVRESKESTSIMPKQKNDLAKNQLELSWNNSLLDTSYVSIIGRAMLKEWERVLPEFPVYRAFFHTKNEDEVKLFVTFSVVQDLTGEEIKRVVFTATDILNECLEKVSKKVLGDSYSKENSEESVTVSQTQSEATVDTVTQEEVEMTKYEQQLTEQDDLIRQLTLEIEHQESILKGLSNINEQEAPSETLTNVDKLAEINELHGKLSTYETQFNLLKSREINLIDINNQLADEKANLSNSYQQKLNKLEMFNNQKDEEIEHLDGKVKQLDREIQALTTKLNTNDEMNRQLDKANLKLNDMLKQNKLDSERMSYSEELEQKNKDLEKEKSYFKVQFLDSQRLSQQLDNTNRRLNETLERLQSSQSDLVGKARDDYSTLEITLEESNKKLKWEVNERQKLELQLTELNNRLAEEKLFSEAREKKLINLENKLSNRLEEKEVTLASNQQLEKDLEQKDIQMKEALEQKDIQIENIKKTNESLNEQMDYLEAQKNKWESIDEWQEKYTVLESKFEELDKEGYSYRQEINLLISQISKLENKLKLVPIKANYSVSTKGSLDTKKDSVAKKEELDAEYEYTDGLDDEYEYEYEYEYFSYEEDPFVEDVVTEELMNIRKKDQVKDEAKIKALLESSDEATYRDVKVEVSEYKKYIIAFKFLSFRWDQVYMMDDADKNSEFLEWCSPYIEGIDYFQEDLSYDVKKSIFKKKYVSINESALNLLRGYSELSTYLDTYYLRVSYYIDKYFLNEGKK